MSTGEDPADPAALASDMQRIRDMGESTRPHYHRAGAPDWALTHSPGLRAYVSEYSERTGHVWNVPADSAGTASGLSTADLSTSGWDKATAGWTLAARLAGENAELRVDAAEHEGCVRYWRAWCAAGWLAAVLLWVVAVILIVAQLRPGSR